MQRARLRPQEILLPVRPAFIVVDAGRGAAAQSAAVVGLAGSAIKPDFVALVVLYWCIQQPRKVGFTAALLLGLVMDVADGSLFGQHALAYSMLAFAGIVLHRRVQTFTMRAADLARDPAAAAQRSDRAR